MSSSMAKTISSTLNIFLLFTLLALVHGDNITIKKHYIVYMGEHSHPNSKSVIKANHRMLSSVTASLGEAREAAVYHYTKSFRGFSAMLTEEQARKLEESDSVISVFESKMYKLHTTHSWDFLGTINNNGNDRIPTSSPTSDVVVGVVDTGVWPESDSFNDKDMGPVPKKFKGTCATGQNFTSANCNRKIIGARFYYKGFVASNGPLESFGSTFFLSPRDSDGHGTHTSSTIAGRSVPNTSMLGIATGSARGGAPGARLAIYKACWFEDCSDSDILAAMDDAIYDGVDVLSLSLGPSPPQPTYFNDAISIGAFHAFRAGVFVACSAGNSAFPKTATNIAPWILTVAASSIDREFASYLYLGNSKVLKGLAVNPLKMEASYALIAGSDAAAPGVTAANASACLNNTLDPSKVAGKIVICTLANVLEDRRQKATIIQQAGGVGMILIDPLVKDVCFQYVIPATVLGQPEAEQLQAYMKTGIKPVARISPTVTVTNIKPAPKVAVFSSQGPNVVSPDIIKPDITAPGLNILAAWSPVAIADAGGRQVNYNIISGTSMSCPHVAAVAAIIKSQQPSWSPAAIKSAIMTSAAIVDNTGNGIERFPNGNRSTPFDYGSGHINPKAVLNPGLIYEFDSNDVINFLCGTGATSDGLKNLTGQLTNCQNPIPASRDFNYPSIGISKMQGSISVYRTVTYYGKGPTAYIPYIDHPAGVTVSVTPAMLKFTSPGQKLRFRIDFTPSRTSGGDTIFGALTWSNGIHKVRSPIAINVLSLKDELTRG